MVKHEILHSTDGLPVRDTAGAWCTWMAELFHGLGSDLYGDTTFDGHLRTANVGDVVMTHLEGNRHRVMHTPRGMRTSEPAYLKVVAPWRGLAIVEQSGRKASVRPGGWVIYDTTSRYEVANPERSEHLIVMLSKERLQERGLLLDAIAGRTVGGGSGISRVALEAMRNTFHELPTMAPETARGAGELILDLVHLSLQELVGQETATTQLEAFRDRIRAYIGRHLRDPDLSVDRIAQALNCSKRHLHHAFEDEDDTLARYILHQRLRGCMRELKSPDATGRTVTDIAFSWGFNSGAHFSRVFRQHVGVSPVMFRAAAASQANELTAP